MKKKSKHLIWKAEDQRCCVLISMGGKTYQVSLNEENQRAIAFILPQLFPNHKVMILPEELPIEFPVDNPILK